MNLVLFKLQAINPSHAINCFYSVCTGQDLLGDWIVGVCYKRFGTGGHARTWLCRTKEEAQQKVRQCLSNRLSALKRIGVNYTFTQMDGHPFLNIEDWSVRKKMT